MGFYAPAQLVREAQRQGVHVLPVCINRSDSEADLERHEDEIALRLGFNQISGLAVADYEALVAARRLAGRLTVLPIVPSAPGLARRAGTSGAGRCVCRSRIVAAAGFVGGARAGTGKPPAALPLFAHRGLDVLPPEDEHAAALPPCRRAWKCWKIMPACDCRSRRIPCRFCAKICTRATFDLCRLWTRRQWSAHWRCRSGDLPPASGKCPWCCVFNAGG